MNFFPLLAAFVGAFEQLDIKYTLSELKLNVARFNVQFFPIIFLVTLALTPFNWQLDWVAVRSFPRVIEILALITVGAIWHVAYFRGVKKEHVDEFELFRLLQPLVAASLAALLFSSERIPLIGVAITLSSLILVLAHFRHHHFYGSSATRYLLIGTIAMGVEAVLVKDLIQFFSPIVLLAIYSGGLTIIFYRLFPSINDPGSARQIRAVITAAILGALYGLLLFSSIKLLGVARTTMLLMVEPLLVYMGARFLLRETLHPTKVVAGLTVAAIVIWVNFVS